MTPLVAANDALQAELQSALPADCLKPVAPHYLEDPRDMVQGQGGIVAAPRNAQEVSEIVKLCAKTSTPLVPFGGGTGLVAGHIMPEGPAPLILSLERMKAIREVLPEEGVIIAEAGATLHDVQVAAEDNDMLFPLSLAAEGTCRIGGNLATNAGGVNVLRYGNARDLCLGLEAVLPDGQIWNGLTRLRKDNTGYDLRNLLIGSEGTLGVITAATLRLFPRPSSTSTALFVVPNPDAALKLFAATRKNMGEMISAFELIQKTGLEFLTATMPDLRQPFDSAPDWVVLVELGLPNGLDGEAALMELFEQALEDELVTDGLIAQSVGQRADFWNVREHIPEANRLIGSISNHDISLPLGAVARFIDEAEKAIAEIGPVQINCFGHLGDGNLHFNAFPPKGEDRANWMHLKPALAEIVHELVHKYHGSFSAEHGVGRAKTEELQRYGDPAKLSAMAAIKAALDSAGIMNPGAVLKRQS